ncbi:hypothetical protein HPB52_006035 [Rhipicephalus sanguineus]|uniref:PiggyBac transposable element-derived protein domain-containing protein n=1 Tax=Rhipicephalus sanguineus TaxID=34632 RepID=A0A9D4T8N3_RHISA|nr:hypothetical protein HPB52_006035 [Rhipicephalus sanguineus]
MADELPVDVRHLPFHFYFDNLFTSLHLLRHLKEKNYEATGTVRQNRVPKECPIARPDFIKRKTRGYEEHALSDDGIIIVRWMDNSVVTIASTVHGVEPMSSADRYSRAQKKRIKVPRPNAVTQYNCFMGGTDQMDANVAQDPTLLNLNSGDKSLKATSHDGKTSQKDLAAEERRRLVTVRFVAHDMTKQPTSLEPCLTAKGAGAPETAATVRLRAQRDHMVTGRIL